MYEEFKFFMKYNGHWENFVRNVSYFDKLVNCKMNKDQFFYIISNTFNFKNSDEGADFWHEINTDWKTFVNYWEEDFDAIYYRR